MAQQAHDLRAQLGNGPDADLIAQAVVCAAPILARVQNCDDALNWLRPQLETWEKIALNHAAVLSTLDFPLAAPLQSHHLFDGFLHHYSRRQRKHGGVFFTPEPIADFIVAQIDRLLREECGFSAGLADDRVTIIDPACGTGVFLLAVINFLRAKMGSQGVESLLPRLIGIEILPPAAFLAKLNIALSLANVDYDFRRAGPILVITADALTPHFQSKILNPESQISFPVLLGNPPFCSLSTNGNEWITRLVRGDDEIRGYARANGRELGERKTWLHDDYVKFIRLAQWHIEEAGQGLVGFVTNHGYLDNATFRLMRHELLRVFPHIEILDLHGNRKKHEIAPDGNRDENVFDLDQGIAISLLCRPVTAARSASESGATSVIRYTDLWGSRDQKLKTIGAATVAPEQSRLPSSALGLGVLTPEQPDWRFVPANPAPQCKKYASAWSLVDAMPVNTTAPVTARDHFVVGFTREELITRIEAFRNLDIPDDEIRERYFHRTRSARYQAGDTRGWKLAAARRIVADDDNWPDKIIRCLYRPFDWRFVFWHPAMIDWPRNEVTQHLITKNQEPRTTHIQNPKSKFLNLCLIARRQQLPTQPCTFFWISDCLALDGVIRSDNRGSESLFPLYVAWQANFAPAFVEQFAILTKRTWLSVGRGDLDTTFGPEDLLAYIYALFHSPSYRNKYAHELRWDFPRILMPRTHEQFVRMTRFGRELIDNHLLRVPEAAIDAPHSAPRSPQTLSSFRAGGYLALKKWLQPKHRSERDPDYRRITAAIERTIDIMDQINALDS